MNSVVTVVCLKNVQISFNLRSWCFISGIGKRFFLNFLQGCFEAYPVSCALCSRGYFPDAKVAGVLGGVAHNSPPIAEIIMGPYRHCFFKLLAVMPN